MFIAWVCEKFHSNGHRLAPLLLLLMLDDCVRVEIDEIVKNEASLFTKIISDLVRNTLTGDSQFNFAKYQFSHLAIFRKES